jgi:hypothetical protein
MCQLIVLQRHSAFHLKTYIWSTLIFFQTTLHWVVFCLLVFCHKINVGSLKLLHWRICAWRNSFEEISWLSLILPPTICKQDILHLFQGYQKVQLLCQFFSEKFERGEGSRVHLRTHVMLSEDLDCHCT